MITAHRTPVHRGPAAWAEILGYGSKFPTLETNTVADVAIIGAGFAGLSAARRLLELDNTLKIAVLEAGRVAEGGTGRNSGFMIDIPHDLTSEDYRGGPQDHALIKLNREAQQFGQQAVDDYGILPAFFDRSGKINGAGSAKAEAHNTSFADHLTLLNETNEVLDAQSMHDITGSRYYRSGLYTPGTVMLQPAGYIRGIAAGLRRDGVDIYENSPVRRLDHGWRATSDKGSISAKNVILAVNGHLESFGFLAQRLMHVFLFGAMTADLGDSGPKGQPRWGITPSDPMGTTVRRIDGPQGGNRIVVRTCAALRPGMEATIRDLGRAQHTMQGKLNARYPGLKAKLEYVWAGHLCLARNGVSVLKELEQGLFSACVQNGLGTTRGTLAGIGAAEKVMEHTSDITQFFGAQDTPSPLPPPMLQTLGGNALLRWKELQARTE